MNREAKAGVVPEVEDGGEGGELAAPEHEVSSSREHTDGNHHQMRMLCRVVRER